MVLFSLQTENQTDGKGFVLNMGYPSLVEDMFIKKQGLIENIEQIAMWWNFPTEMYLFLAVIFA